MVCMRIAIVKLSALGDIIHAMIVLQVIKKHYENVSIDWFVEEKYKELLERHPDISEVHTLSIKRAKKDKSLLTFLNDLKRLKQLKSYDIVLDLQGLFKSGLITRLIPSKRKIGFDKTSIRERLASVFYNERYRISYEKNIVERNVGLINFAFDITSDVREIENKKPFVFPNNDYFFDQISTKKKNILIIPGASFASKCYPTEKYSKLVNQINSNFLVTWGTDKEQKLAKSIKSMSPKIEIMDKLSINKLISLIKKVDLVIGSDTGPTHLAWALNIPSITLYGPTPGYRNSYATTINRYIESESKVNPYKIDRKDFSSWNWLCWTLKCITFGTKE